MDYEEEKEEGKENYGSLKAHPQKGSESPFSPEPVNKRKVQRVDGLPTVDDLAKMFGKQNPHDCGCEGEGCEACEGEQTAGDKVGKMVEIILKIG